MHFKINGSLIWKGKLYEKEQLQDQVELMKYKIGKLALQEDEVVAIALPRRKELITTIFALLELHIPFVPIDYSQADERTSYILENCGVRYLLTLSDSGCKDYGKERIFLDTFVANAKEVIPEPRENEVAYIMYTSGSTGRPKGVEVTRRGLSNFMVSIPQIIPFNKSSRIACLTNATFDIFFLESVLSLICGLTVVLFTEEERNNPKIISDYIHTFQIDMLQMTPSMMKILQLYDQDVKCLGNVSILMLGGEPLPQNLLRMLQRKTKASIYNMYGPTETTIWSSISNLTKKEEIDVGRPIHQTQIYILDKNLKEVLHNEIGEICIAGAGLAKGYRKNEELTKKAFVSLKDKGNLKVYRTGDLGRYDETGNLICYGRIDNQIKLHGNRIELEEIDEQLSEFPKLQISVTCLKKGDFEDELITFYQSESKIESAQLRAFLKDKIPEVMIPKKYVLVQEIFYTTSGKADRNRLLEAYGKMEEPTKTIDDESKKEENLSDRDQVIHNAIRVILHNSNLSLDFNTDLATIGFESISFIKLVAELEDYFDIEFDADYLSVDIIKTVGGLIDYVKELSHT